MSENQQFDEVPEGTYDDNQIFRPVQDYLLPNKVYSTLDPVTKVIIPGFGAFYFALAQVWGLPNGNEVVATCAAVATFLGLFLVFAERTYDKSQAKYDGAIYLTEGETVDGRRMKDAQFGIRQDLDAQTISGRKQIIMKVVNE